MSELLYHLPVTLKVPQTVTVQVLVPDHVSVNYSIVDGKPGLQVNTRNTRNWTPTVTLTRAKLKLH